MAKTHQKYKINNLLGLWNRTTEEMFATNPQIADIVFNTSLQIPVVYTLNGWADFAGNLILHNLFYEDFKAGNLDNFTIVNDSVNKWIVGTDIKFAGNYSAYISNDNAHAQYNKNQSQISHIYTSLTLPDSEQIKLSLFAKIAGESGYDYGRLYWLPTGITPTAGSLPNSSYLISNTLVNIDWTEINIDLTDKKNTTGNLVFTHRNDGSVGTNPGFCVDNVRVDYK